MGKKHGTDGILCRQVPVPGYGAWILPSERVPVPGYRAQVFVRAPLKGYVHIGARAQAPNPGTKSGRGLTLWIHFQIPKTGLTLSNPFSHWFERFRIYYWIFPWQRNRKSLFGFKIPQKERTLKLWFINVLYFFQRQLAKQKSQLLRHTICTHRPSWVWLRSCLW